MSTVIIDGETYRVDYDGRSHSIDVHHLSDSYEVERVGEAELPKEAEKGSVEFVKEQRDAIKEMVA